MSRIRLALAVCAVALIALPTIASARPGHRGFDRTYPHASRLCMKVANGHVPHRLAASSAQVSTACATLRTSFTNAQNAFTTTVAPLRQQAVDAVKALRETCRQAHATNNDAACRQARQDTRAKLKGLRAQVRDAAKAYHTAVDAARKTFWTTIKTLRGGSTMTP